ncbi:Ankyrin repeat-containing domain protein [Rhypophila decipiens]
MVALLGAGSPVDVPLPDTHPRENRRGLTPLLLVAQNSQLSPHPSSSQDAEPDVEHNPPLKTITHLVSLGADPTIQGALNQSALFFAILASNLPLVKYLSTLPKVDLSFIKTTESKPLHAAALSSNPDLITFLVKTANCPINEPDSEGYTALIHAAGYAKPDSSANQVGAVLQASTIKTLVSLGADTEASISDGRRALHFAAFKGQVACLSELIRQGADISAVDDNHWTALHFAARYHHPECIKILLDNGRGKKNLIGQVVNGGPRPKYKDGNEIDITGFNAADLARSVRGGEETVALLIKYGEVLSQKTRDLEDDELWEEKGSSQCCVM